MAKLKCLESVILNLNISDYISSLSGFEQTQTGSLGTRLATFYSSIKIFLSDPLIFTFGTGGGNSYRYLIEYIFNNKLDNFELNVHYSNNPTFITDKTYLIKFITEFGIVGFILLLNFLRLILLSKNSLHAQISNYFIYFIFLLLCQSQFLLIFISVANYLYNVQNYYCNTKLQADY